LTTNSTTANNEIIINRLIAGSWAFDIGVESAIHNSAVRNGELIAGEPVVGSLHKRQRGQNRRHVNLDRRNHSLSANDLYAYSAVEVVGDDRDYEHDHDRGECPTDNETQERQSKYVEPEVLVELRVGDAEILAVDEQKPRLPLAVHPCRSNQGEQGRRDRAYQTSVTVDHFVVSEKQLLLGTGLPKRRSDAVGNHQIAPHQYEKDAGEDQRQHDLRTENSSPNRRVSERMEPQVVGVETGNSAERGEQHEEGHDSNHENHPPARAKSTSSAGGLICDCMHQ